MSHDVHNIQLNDTKFAKLEDFLSGIKGAYTYTLAKHGIEHTDEDEEKFEGFVRSAIWAKYTAKEPNKVRQDLNLVVLVEKYSIFNMLISKGGDKLIMIYYPSKDNHYCNLYETEIDKCDCLEFKDKHETVNENSWAWYLIFGQYEFREEKTEPETPKAEEKGSDLGQIMERLEALKH